MSFSGVRREEGVGGGERVKWEAAAEREAGGRKLTSCRLAKIKTNQKTVNK